MRTARSGQARSGEVDAMWAGRILCAALSRAPRGCRPQSALAQLRGILEEELEGIREAGTWKSERVITSRQGPRIHVDGVSGGNGPRSCWESSDLARRSRAVLRLGLEWRSWRPWAGRSTCTGRCCTLPHLSGRLVDLSASRG